MKVSDTDVIPILQDRLCFKGSNTVNAGMVLNTLVKSLNTSIQSAYIQIVGVSGCDILLEYNLPVNYTEERYQSFLKILSYIEYEPAISKDLLRPDITDEEYKWYIRHKLAERANKNKNRTYFEVYIKSVFMDNSTHKMYGSNRLWEYEYYLSINGPEIIAT